MRASWLLFGVVVSSSQTTRGVQPANLDRYTGAQFTCADGSLTIPITMVNDDYCDCNDGTDEPGTSACRRGTFYCANRGYQSLTLPSSRVNDGICDCCDGSDEWKEKVKCTNNCIELGRESVKDLVAEVERYEAGVAKLQDLIATGRSMKAEKDKALAEASTQLEALEAELKGLEEQKIAEEKLEKEEQDRRSPPPPAAAPVEETAPTSPPEVVPTPEPAVEEEKFPYPKEYQYKEEKKEEEASAFPYPKEYQYKEGEKKEEETVEEEAAEAEPEAEEAPATNPEPPAEKYISPAAEAARTAHRTKETEVRNARDNRDKLQKDLAYDFGAQGEYMSLLGTCFDVQVRQYTYEACPYGSAAQKEGSSSTSLGSWAGFEKKENGQLVMKFSGGAKCWQGPERSFNVDVECGVDTQLSNVDEPSKCVYTAKLVTPAACNEAQAKTLRDQLNVLLSAQS